MVHYVKENFFTRHAGFESLAHLNRLLVQWMQEVADERIHGTVKERVLNRFAREQSCLKPLPALGFDTSYREQRRVPSDAYINVRTNVSARGTPSTIYRTDPDTGSLSFIREAPCPQNVICGFNTSTPGKRVS